MFKSYILFSITNCNQQIQSPCIEYEGTGGVDGSS